MFPTLTLSVFLESVLQFVQLRPRTWRDVVGYLVAM